MEETLRLTWGSVDLAKGTVFVEGKVKNEYSRRLLPMPALLRMILQDAPKDGDRVVSSHEKVFSWQKALRGQRHKRKDKTVKEVPGFMDRFEPKSYIPPKNFRKVLSTEAEVRLWNDRVLDDFYGHSREGTRRKFYSIPELEKMVDLYRSEVTDKIDLALSKATEAWERISGEIVSLRPRLVPTEVKKAVAG